MTAPDPRLAEARLAATAAAVGGDAATLYHLVSGLMDEGYPFEAVLFEVLAPLQRDVGTRWQSGDYLISEEHAATATVETVVSLLAGAFDRPSEGPDVVVAAAQGDHHSLPPRLVATHLIFSGFRPIFLGANVLATDLREYLELAPPAALVLSCSMTSHLVGARESIRAGHAVGVPVLVGGNGFGESGAWASSVGADAWAPNPRQVPEMLDSWRPDPVTAEAGAMEPSRELTEVSARRADIIALALGNLSTRSVANDSRAHDELSILLGAVEAALLVGDDRPVLDMLAWQEATLAAHRLPLAEAIADALREAVADISPGTERVFRRSPGRSTGPD